MSSVSGSFFHLLFWTRLIKNWLSKQNTTWLTLLKTLIHLYISIRNLDCFMKLILILLRTKFVRTFLFLLFYLSFCQVHQNEDCENCNSWFEMFDILSKVFMPPQLRVGGGILIYPCPSVRPDIDTWFVRLSPTVLELQATALKFCRMFIHTMEVCMSTGDWFSSNILKMTGSWTCHFVRPSRYRYMVCLYLLLQFWSHGRSAMEANEANASHLKRQV